MGESGSPAARRTYGRTRGSRAPAYLHDRGLHDDTIRAHGLGYQPKDVYEDRGLWGLSAGPEAKASAWLLRGIVIPWQIEGGLWRINACGGRSRRGRLMQASLGTSGRQASPTPSTTRTRLQTANLCCWWKER
ncbi:MAG: hypothetical protein U0X20_00665 [Caldilineaceae bacterium]